MHTLLAPILVCLIGGGKKRLTPSSDADFVALAGNLSKPLRQCTGGARIDVCITERKLVLQASLKELPEDTVQ